MGDIFDRLAKPVLWVVLLLAAAGAALEYAVPKEELRPLVVDRMQRALGRQVKLASVSLGPWTGLRMEGLSISETPTFDAGTFFEAERLTTRFRFWPMLVWRFSIGEVQITKPKIRLARGKDGRLNVADLLEGRAADAPGPAAAPGATGPLPGSAPARPGLPGGSSAAVPAGAAAAPEESSFLAQACRPVLEKPFAIEELWDAVERVLAA
jgi:uncharacterized protein involved in outer membrane biogenesis